MKKVLIIVGIIIIVAFLGIVFLIKGSIGDQLAMQYEEVPETPYKLLLDTEKFDKVISDDRYLELEKWVPFGSIKTIQSKIKSNDLSVEELVAFYGKRIGKLDGEYNSVIRLSDTVLEKARLQDDMINNGEGLKELTGVIVIVKDNVSVLGMNTSAGSYALKDSSTTRSSFVVSTLESKGALILGKANLSEFSNFMSQPSSNGFSTLGGQTKNPYGKYDVGGSSSGSSVAASLGFSTITIGSETAGSLIYPAGQNSVVAIKPSLGLLSRDLVIPISEAQDTLGYIGRNVEDVFKVFKNTIAKDEEDLYSGNFELLSNDEFNGSLDNNYIFGKTIGVINDGSEEINIIVDDLKKLGCEVVPVEISDEVNEVDMMSVLTYGIKHDLNNYLQNASVNGSMKSLEEIIKFNGIDGSRAPYGQYYLELGQENTIDEKDYRNIVEKNTKITSKWIDSTLKENNIDYLVSISNSLSGIYAPAGYPAVTVPSGYRENGEPYGVTFVGGMCKDLSLLNFAYGYEQGTLYRKNPR